MGDDELTPEVLENIRRKARVPFGSPGMTEEESRDYVRRLKALRDEMVARARRGEAVSS